MKRIMLFIFLLIYLSGCTASQVIPFTSQLDDVGGIVADASTAKEMIIGKSWIAYYKMQRKSYKNSGAQITGYQRIDIGGGNFMVMPLISIRQPLDVEAPPREPSKHPVWNFLTRTVEVVTPMGFGYLIADSIVRGYMEMSKGPRMNFEGDASFRGSFNSLAGDKSTLSIPFRRSSEMSTTTTTILPDGTK